MKATRIVATVVAALAAWMPAQSAQVCEFTRTPWGLRVTGCKLSDLYQGRYDLAIDVDANRPRIRLPNLLVADVDAAVTDKGVDVSVEVQNDGNGNAGAFEVAVVASVNDPLNNGSSVGMTPLGPVSVPVLLVGAGLVSYAGRIFLPNRTQDWDVCTVAVVDPPAAGRPASGSVLESNESDNQRQGCCRVFGPNPDLNGPPACL